MKRGEGGVTDALLRRVKTLQLKQPPLDKILPQDTTAATEQIQKSMKEHRYKFGLASSGFALAKV